MSKKWEETAKDVQKVVTLDGGAKVISFTSGRLCADEYARILRRNGWRKLKKDEVRTIVRRRKELFPTGHFVAFLRLSLVCFVDLIADVTLTFESIVISAESVDVGRYKHDICAYSNVRYFAIER